MAIQSLSFGGLQAIFWKYQFKAFWAAEVLLQ
jgi:hypothetical protein